MAAASTWPRDVLLAELHARGVPACPIYTVEQALSDPQIVARGVRIEPGSGADRSIPGLRAPLKFSDSALTLDRPAPTLGNADRPPTT